MARRKKETILCPRCKSENIRTLDTLEFLAYHCKNCDNFEVIEGDANKAFAARNEPDIPLEDIQIHWTDIDKQIGWSLETFGPGARIPGVINHIKKELKEISAAPDDLSEWIDVIILAIDGAQRQGYSATEIIKAYHQKMETNINRKWPDWRKFSEGEAIEHIRD